MEVMDLLDGRSLSRRLFRNRTFERLNPSIYKNIGTKEFVQLPKNQPRLPVFNKSRIRIEENRYRHSVQLNHSNK